MRMLVMMIAALVAITLGPTTLSAVACDGCGWFEGGGAKCEYGSPEGEYEDCTQCSYWACCANPCYAEDEEDLLLLVSGDGSLSSSFESGAAKAFPTGELRPGEAVLARVCDGAVLARHFDADLSAELRSQTSVLSI